MPTVDALDTPCVLIDVDRVERNLARAQAHANQHGYNLRPHTKTHKLPHFARLQVERGAVGITVQKLGEAEVMADAGLNDIFLPYNIVGPHKLARLATLNDRVALRVTADSAETIAGYAATFGATAPLTVLVECDTGGARCGVQTPAEAVALAERIKAAEGLRFGGLMTYPARHRIAEADTWLRAATGLLEQAGLPVPVVTGGNTPDMWWEGDSIVTERRPGTYIYYDRRQVADGVAGWEDCALSVLTTVVSRPTLERAVVDAGSKAFSSDTMGLDGFGLVAGTDLVLAGINEEHGIIAAPGAADMHIGQRLRIIPNHACVVSNLFDAVHLVRGETVVQTLPVAARGRVD